MIEVPLDKIVSQEEAAADINKFIEKVTQEKTIYVLTRDGKPHAAIIDIDYLEHLPELKNAGETKPLEEIGKEETLKEEIPMGGFSENIKPVSPEAQEVPPVSSSEIKPDGENFLDENIGPWKGNDQNNQEAPEEEIPGTQDKPNEPPDLPI